MDFISLIINGVPIPYLKKKTLEKYKVHKNKGENKNYPK